MDFKTWKEQKKVKDQDLIFTRALKSPQHLDLFTKVSEQMAPLTPSFTEGVAFLELATDLILMGHMEALFEKTLTFETWSLNLKKLRVPHTDLRDSDLKEKLEKLPWPQGSKIKFERRGDKSGIELKLFISNPTDLTKILASLERVQLGMKE